MSRIFDALQRADSERRPAHDTETEEAVEPFALPGAEQQPPVEAVAVFENIAQHRWKPSLLALPTLGERGESIEQFRGLRSQIYQFRDQDPLKTILVTSGIPCEGKTFVASNLAVSLARNEDNSVLLIDADLRSPSLHSILGAPNLPGLTEYLAGSARIDDILQRSSNPGIVEAAGARAHLNFAFIPAGAGGDNSSELLANHRIEELIAALSQHFDWILIDSPPVLAFSDSVDLARAADAVLLVARGSATSYDVAQRAQAAFVNSRILGFVLNAVKDAPSNASYYYGYSYGGQDAGRGSHRRKDKRRQG